MIDSRGLRVNEEHLMEVFRVRAVVAELAETVTVPGETPVDPEHPVRLRVLRLGRWPWSRMRVLRDVRL